MSAAFYARLLFFCLQTVVVEAELAQPQNVTLITLNTNYTLSWDWNQSPAESHTVTFTTQYVGKYKLQFKKKSPVWSTVCDKTLIRSCDLTVVSLHYLGIYMLRVRTNMNGSHSSWVQKEFCPDKDAALGPPTNVSLSPAGSDLDVVISDPVNSSNVTMRDHIPTLYYNIVYWERSAGTQTQMLKTSANIVTLPNLKAWTWYCVRVQSCYDFYNKSSSSTSPQCMQTEGNVPWWQIFLYFLGSLVICFLVMLVSLSTSFWCYKTIKTTFYPSSQLPSHLKMYLDSTGSHMPGLLTPDPESELLCDIATVWAEPTVLEIHNPPPESLLSPQSGPDPDNRHSRQDSSSSGDSGVYSTGGSSNLQQPSTSQSCTVAKDFVWGPVDLEQLKMQEIASGLKSQLLVADEGIVDMCV
ncbi:interleukin-10 receptor subunit beta [Anabas testudineus]|uniref:Fibronectin type-III domain-containing protein n=1 Tax=Anabas testudineus TaxID=64144 RepID=A0A3Q1HI28_ANATE|nr:interleukin-10 receptor subunit beta [Anabas testudineus]